MGFERHWFAAPRSLPKRPTPSASPFFPSGQAPRSTRSTLRSQREACGLSREDRLLEPHAQPSPSLCRVPRSTRSSSDTRFRVTSHDTNDGRVGTGTPSLFSFPPHTPHTPLLLPGKLALTRTLTQRVHQRNASLFLNSRRWPRGEVYAADRVAEPSVWSTRGGRAFSDGGLFPSTCAKRLLAWGGGWGGRGASRL